MGFLNSLDIPIPANIYLKVFGGEATIIGSHNYFDYICFDEKEAVDFFKNLEFIINYDDFANLNLEEINEIAYEIGRKIVDIVNKFNSMSIEVRRNNSKILEYFQKLEYMYLCISIIHKFKLNNEPLLMPNKLNQIKRIK